MRTNGGSYSVRTMRFEEYQGKIIKFEIWDTAGQEKYPSLTKFFNKNADIIISVYDITRKKTFEEITNNWYNQIKEYAPKDVSK